MNKLHCDSILDVLVLTRADERSLGCVHHDAEVKASIVKFYIVTRLHFLVKGINKAKEERRKMLQHLKVRRCV